MPSNIVYRFNCYVDTVIDKHRTQVRKFRLGLTQWGNIDPMLSRIREELWQNADGYEIDDDQKAQIIDSALQKIKSYYY